MQIALILGIIIGVLLAWHQFRLLKQLKRSLLREQRAREDRDAVVSFVNDFAKSIVQTDDSHRWMEMVAKFVADAVGAKSLVIYTVDNDRLTKVASIGAALPETPPVGSESTFTGKLITELAQSGLGLQESRLGEVYTSGSTMLENLDAKGPSTTYTIESVLLAPMSISDNKIGLICAVNKRLSGLGFSQEDRYLLEALSTQVALGGYLIQMYQELGAQDKLGQEARLAAGIQRSLLPEYPPAGRRLKVGAINIPANTVTGDPAKSVSGDFYDFVELDEDNMLVVIADASGKGMPACMLMAMCRSFLRTNAQRYRHDLEGLLAQLSENLYDDTDEGKFITMACCLVNKKDNVIEYARAGHTELLIRNARGEVHIIQPTGPALGLLPPDFNPGYDSFSFLWQPGMSILLFTDAITEAVGTNGEEFGLDRLVELWKGQDLDPDRAIVGILEGLYTYTDRELHDDDLTMVVLSNGMDVKESAN